jgi:CDP-glycerol glycerophosphotransferase
MLNTPRKLVDTVRKSSWKLGRAVRLEIYSFWRTRAVDPNLVMYEAFGGNGVLCNPEAIFRGLRKDSEFSRLKHVWVLSSASGNPEIVQEFAGDRSVRFVRPNSAGYYRALATSRYLINNATFPVEFSKRAGQTYLNTWHGTPLKRMGFDIGDTASRVANSIRNFLAADYLLAANHFMTEQMYENAHKLRGIYRGLIVEEGYPRIDRQFVDAGDVASIRARLDGHGLDLRDRQVILYAPTWKGASFIDPRDDAEELIRTVSEIESRIDSTRYVVLLKTHQVVHKFAAERPEFAGRLIPNEIPTNSILAATDILVTDYSSIFFDFLATGRPIAFLASDIDDYAGYRGLYMEPGEWPGPVATTIDELTDNLNRIADSGVAPEIAQRYLAMQQRYVAREDGGATQRVIDIVFRGKHEDYSVKPVEQDARESILINVGGMMPNRVTTAAIDLLNTIDHDRFDVSVVFPYSRRQVILKQQTLIHPAVRQFARVGTMNGSQLSQLVRRISWFRGAGGTSLSTRQLRLWDEEWARCFGLSTFDYVVDFSGYGRLWSQLMLHAPDARRSIWLHDDLAAVARRAETKDRRQFRELRTVFSTYRTYDHLVSESAQLRQVNAASLSEYADSGMFTWAPNATDPERIRMAARAAEPAAPAPAVPSDTRTFVTIGRLSPENNQALLIRSFALIHSENPSTRLVIIGGGPMRDQLTNLANELGLAESLSFTGHKDQPYSTMATADCVVLLGDNEASRRLAFEASMLDVPVIRVADDPVDQLRSSHLRLPTTEQAVTASMQAFLRGEIAAEPFSAEAWKQEASDRFCRAIGAVEPAATDRAASQAPFDAAP